jgi:hypothetical protein
VRIPQHQALGLTLPQDGSEARITVTTRYQDFNIAHQLPTELIAIVELSADDKLQALHQATQVSNVVSQMLSLFGNGAIDDMKPQLLLSISGDTRPEFVQFNPGPWSLGHASNAIRDAAAGSAVVALLNDSNIGVLYTATRNYSLALRDFAPGQDTFAVSHLFMGIEALKQLAIEDELRKRGGWQRNQLAAEWAVTTSQLENEGRLRLLFQGDSDTHREAKAASDGLEHGYLTFADVQKHAEAAKAKTAEYLRTAILRLMGLDEATRDELLTDEFSTPPQPGEFQGIVGDLPAGFDLCAAVALDLEVMSVVSSPQSTTMDDSGRLSVTMNSKTAYRVDNTNVFGLLYSPGTNMTRTPRPTSVTRASGEVEVLPDESDSS